jgi:hypothetical protein
VSDSITLVLPEPPSLNEMIQLAKRRTRRSRTGGWMKRALPVVYDQRLEEYETRCSAAARSAGARPPASPWPRWRLVSMHFRLHNRRDWLELAAGAKWCIDFLVREGYVAGDSPREMERPAAWPTQEIARKDRGVIITIEAADTPAQEAA